MNLHENWFISFISVNYFYTSIFKQSVLAASQAYSLFINFNKLPKVWTGILTTIMLKRIAPW